jgi:predicted anti-sigma-YlaC factor YlaD
VTCREFIERLMEYVEGTAPGDAFEHHLARCSSCRAYLDSYLKTIGLARGAFPPS